MLITKFVCKYPRGEKSWFSISWTVQIHALVDDKGLPLWAAIHLLSSSLRTPAVCYTVHCQLFTMIRIYSQPTAYCIIFFLLSVLLTIVKCVSLVILFVAAWAALWWTDWCLSSCCVQMGDVFDKAPSNRLDLDPLSPDWGGCVSMICGCGIGEEDDNKKKWEVLRNIL